MDPDFDSRSLQFCEKKKKIPAFQTKPCIFVVVPLFQ